MNPSLEVLLGQGKQPAAIFVEAAKASKQWTQISQATGTILIPTDGAFQQLLAAVGGSKDDLLSEVQFTANVLQFHLLDTLIPSLAAFDSFPTLTTRFRGETLDVYGGPSGVTLKGDMNAASIVSQIGLVGSQGVSGPGCCRALPGSTSVEPVKVHITE
jgi:hypothetical protein